MTSYTFYFRIAIQTKEKMTEIIILAFSENICISQSDEVIQREKQTAYANTIKCYGREQICTKERYKQLCCFCVLVV